MSGDRACVFVVDDDPVVLRALERAIRAAGYDVESFDSANSFLERTPRCEGVSCAVLDLRLPDVSGLDLQHALLSSGRPMSIVFLSGSSDIPSVTSAMRRGAVDFLVKPVDEDQLLDAIARALEHGREQLQAEQQQKDVDERLSRLTKREREVCMLVQRGLLNKQIAQELGTTEKTIKVHRGRMMHKLEVDSVAALVRFLSRQPAPAAFARKN
jgi:RNA polymerase sigma factor (sigma-70 family)